MCISQAAVCDGIFDCDDITDESNCGNISYTINKITYLIKREYST